MPPLDQVERVLWLAGIVLALLLIVRMIFTELYRTYVWFFGFLWLGVIESAVAFPLDPNTNAYAWVYVVSQPINWLFYILVVLELYSLLLRDHPGIASVGRWVLSAASAVSILISGLTLWPDLSRPAGKYPVLVYYAVIERGLISSLLIFLLFAAAFLVWYPIPLTRNLVLHANVYAVYFLASTLALYVRNLTGFEITRSVSTVLMGASALCLLVWLMFFGRRGEEQMVVLRPRWQPEDEEKLIEQMNALNSALLRAQK